MKNKIFFLFFVLTGFYYSLHAQTKNKISCVTYKIGRIVNDSPKKSVRSTEMKDHFAEIANTLNEIEFSLFFTKSKSLFKAVEKLYSASESAAAMALNISNGNNIYYKDTVEKEKITQTVFANQLFDIKRPYDEYEWAITSESKIISGYRCYKATCEIREYDRRRNIEIVSYPEVWFAPELPYQYGPRGLDGLPGLVLEGKFSTGIYFYASKIELAIKDNSVQIERPTKGKFVTPEEFQTIQIEVLENYPR